MCGIAGYVSFKERVDGEVVRRMGMQLTPRGPDECGFFGSENCAFAHRRLVVIDPDNGQQPMTRGGKTICYNGELYNTAELRAELERLDYSFCGHSDTEVLLAAYCEWGENCLEKLNGIFAFTVWDEERKRLFIARDRAGVKPLLYALVDGGIVFASEQKALLAHPKIRPIINRESIAEIMLLGPAQKPDSGIFRDIKAILPGHYAHYDMAGFSIWEYWRIKAQKHTESVEETARHLQTLITDSVERQLVSDVPLCTFLSGGLDSSIISAIAARKYRCIGKKLDTYSVDYKGNRENFHASKFQPDEDAPWIVRMSNFIDSRHHDVVIDTPQLADALLDSTIARDAPGMADVDSSLFLFCKSVKRGFTVAVSGECADEIFAGYPWFRDKQMLERSGFPWADSTAERFELIKPGLLGDFSASEYVERAASATISRTSVLDSDSPEQRKMREMFMLNYYWFMQTLLTRKDRCSMAHGLEVRVPFCDHRICEYAYNIPPEIKFLNGREKGIVRMASEGLLPSDVAWRKKSPYPKTHNPDYTALMLQRFGETIARSDCRLFELLNAEKLCELKASEGRVFTKNWYGQLMALPQMLAYLIQLEFWLRRYEVEIKP